MSTNAALRRISVSGLVIAIALFASAWGALAESTPVHFTFLPPLSPEAPLADSFDDAASPVVEVCESPACDSVHARFDMVGSSQPLLRVSGRHYIANWHTSKTGAVHGGTYHIRVLADGAVLGSMDVTVSHRGRRASSPHPTVTGAVPIKFRMTDHRPSDPDPAVDSIVVEPADATISVTATQQLTATVYDQHGDVMVGQTVAWSSSDDDVATVDADGLATGHAAGSTTITAAIGAVSGTATLTVQAQTPEDIIEDAAVLYFSDFALGTDQVLAGLQELAGEEVIDLTVATTRDEALAAMAGDHDVLVYFNQNTQMRPEDVAGVVAWVEAGKRTIYSDWTWNTTVLVALQSQRGTSSNQQPLTFLDDRLAVGVQNPMPLTNPGWGVWATGLAPAGGTDAVSVCSFPTGDSCLVYGNEGRTATVGFLNDTVTATDGRNFIRNLLRIVVEGTAVNP